MPSRLLGWGRIISNQISKQNNEIADMTAGTAPLGGQASRPAAAGTLRTGVGMSGEREREQTSRLSVGGCLELFEVKGAALELQRYGFSGVLTDWSLAKCIGEGSAR